MMVVDEKRVKRSSRQTLQLLSTTSWQKGLNTEQRFTSLSLSLCHFPFFISAYLIIIQADSPQKKNVSEHNSLTIRYSGLYWRLSINEAPYMFGYHPNPRHAQKKRSLELGGAKWRTVSIRLHTRVVWFIFTFIPTSFPKFLAVVSRVLYHCYFRL